MKPTLADLRRRAERLKPGLGQRPSSTDILDLIIALIGAIETPPEDRR